MSRDEAIDAAVGAYREQWERFDRFKHGVVKYFELSRELNTPPRPSIHSIKSRLKDPDHLREKLTRKWRDDAPITEANIFERVTDLCGVRVLHLHQAQFSRIHQHIMRNVDEQEWHLAERPKAYSWDPEAKQEFEAMGLDTDIKESLYTSVHYLVRPRAGSPICCEIQVRTLFEEIWGEIDHAVNYPHPAESRACRDQLKVLARLVSTGTRLADAIFSTIDTPGDH